MHPVSFFWGGEFPPEYKDTVKTPMDLGTVTSNLLEGSYHSVNSFVSDCKLISENCKNFYKGRDDGEMFTKQATILEKFVSVQCGSLTRYDQSSDGSNAKKAPITPRKLLKPPKDFLLSIVEGLRKTVYTDRYTKVCELEFSPPCFSFDVYHFCKQSLFISFLNLTNIFRQCFYIFLTL